MAIIKIRSVVGCPFAVNWPNINVTHHNFALLVADAVYMCAPAKVPGVISV